jgi:uncharacterized membrane protein YhfC
MSKAVVLAAIIGFIAGIAFEVVSTWWIQRNYRALPLLVIGCIAAAIYGALPVDAEEDHDVHLLKLDGGFRIVITYGSNGMVNIPCKNVDEYQALCETGVGMWEYVR